MKISMICFSLTGYHTALRLKTGLEKQGHSVLLACKSKYLRDSISVSTSQWAGERFPLDDGIIFVGACGIAVRSIAPNVADKKADPAVVVADECGRFVISLLSGHLGGANALTDVCAEILEAQAVVTTATDLHRRFAVDLFAKKNHCEIKNMKAAKEVSAAVLSGEPVGFYSEFPWKGKLPEGLVLCDRNGRPVNPGNDSISKDLDLNRTEIRDSETEQDRMKLGITVSVHRSCIPFASSVQIIPGIVTLGMGCRKDKDPEGIAHAAENCLKEADMFPEAVEQIASIDIKKDEPGLHALAESLGVPFVTYPGETLMEVQGDFAPSAFVKEITGVDNVCERSAVYGAGNGTLIKRKTGREGVTTALALRNWEVHFE